MIKIQVVSDLHIEYKSYRLADVNSLITPVADVLVMAGDIGSLYKFDQLKNFITNASKLYKAVLYVPGNHEYYEIDNIPAIEYSELVNRLESLGKSIPNLYILNRHSVLIDNVCFAGCTLWSDPQSTDLRFIVKMKDMNSFQYKKRHIEDVEYLVNMAKYCQEKSYKLVAITHYPPSFQTLENSKLPRKKNVALYATNLDHLLVKEQIHTWICGHTHTNFDFVSKGGTRVVSNQKGKGKIMADNFSDHFIVTIE